MSITNLQIGDKAVDVTPDDDAVLEPGVLFVGTGGDVAVRTIGGNEVTFKNVADGSILYVMVDKVMEATTAEDIIILR